MKWLLAGLIFCACDSRPCQVAKVNTDGGVHWLHTALGDATNVDLIENIAVADGLLFAQASGRFTFVSKDACQLTTTSGIATDVPFIFSEELVSFPLTRPGQSSVRALNIANTTDDSFEVAIQDASPFRSSALEVALQPRGSATSVVYFEPPTIGEHRAAIVGTAFGSATRTVVVRGFGGGPLPIVPQEFDAGTIGVIGPGQRRDVRRFTIRNDAPTGEGPLLDLLLPETAKTDCGDSVIASVGTQTLHAGDSAVVELLLPSFPAGDFGCRLTFEAAPQAFETRVS
ncbi:MAG: hypothetical protein QM817_40660 [Archangium sp.]